MTPRGIRNNNPGNLNFAGQKGATIEPKSVTVPKPRFAKFESPQAGLEALRDQLKRYNSRDKIDTVTDVIAKWAPPTENNTKAYISSVAKSMGVGPNDHLGSFTPEILSKLMHSIIRFENGQDPYGSLVESVAGIETKPLMS